MCKVDRLSNRFEPFAVLFLALSIVQYTVHCTVHTCQHMTLPDQSTAVHKACPYVHIWNKGALSPLLSYLGMLFIYVSMPYKHLQFLMPSNILL